MGTKITCVNYSSQDTALIQKCLGSQSPQGCGVWSCAYGYTIMEHSCLVKSRDITAIRKAYSGSGNSDMCNWGAMAQGRGMTKSGTMSAVDRYRKIIEHINRGIPVVVSMEGSAGNGGNHFVLVVGYTAGKTATSITPGDFYIFDPNGCHLGKFYQKGADFNQSKYGIRLYTFNKATSIGCITRDIKDVPAVSGAGSGVVTGGTIVGGKTINVPSGLGTYATREFDLRTDGQTGTKNPYTFPKTSTQWKIQKIWIDNGAVHDSKGFCTLYDRYLIACTSTFGKLGTAMDFYLSNGSVLRCINIDEKSQQKVAWDPTPANKWGHNNGKCILEFCGKISIGDNPYKVLGFSNVTVTKVVTGGNILDGTYTGGELLQDSSLIGGPSIDFQKRSSKLSSSDNFEFIKNEKITSDDDNTVSAATGKSLAKSFKETLEKLNNVFNAPDSPQIESKPLFDHAVQSILQMTMQNYKAQPVRRTSTEMSLATSVVEAPFIQVSFKNNVIGTYGGSLDQYPNYITSLEVTKQNGLINEYKISLVHQIRFGEDPNVLDKLLSTVKYDKIKIKYGDCSSGQFFNDEQALITNVIMNRDYVSNVIRYTISAVSEGKLPDTYTINFSEKLDRPSNIIFDLFYNNQKTSEILLNAFPAMRDKKFVLENNLIPNTDATLKISAKNNLNLLSYLTYLVGCMSNQAFGDDTIRNSTYYLTYEEDSTKGAYIKISEIKSDVNPYKISNNIYSLELNNKNDLIFNFSVDSTSSWELLYDANSTSTEYTYTIENTGELSKVYTPAVASSINIMSEINKNWWTQMIKFPINASLTIKGALKPIKLMSYIDITVPFYGQNHLTSGIYVVTGQKDVISGAGFRTILSLIRVSGN